LSELPVVNASPLIYLAHARLFHLFEQAGFPAVRVPAAVALEIKRRGDQDPTVLAMQAAPWLEEVGNVDAHPRVQVWNLGPGETSVISWAVTHPGCSAILDDLAGRRCAEFLGVPLLGTLGLVLRAKRFGRIEAARPLVNKLREAGMYLSDRVLDQALKLVGE
jgi:predicted nucleic acid-binding protein